MLFLRSHCLPPFPVDINPLIKGQRDIVRKHAEAVDHIAGDREFLSCMAIFNALFVQ